MSHYPKIVFNSSTDYQSAELQVTQMYACVVNMKRSSSISRLIDDVNVIRRALGINKEKGNTTRYEANVKDAYNLLWPYADCYTGETPTPLQDFTFTLIPSDYSPLGLMSVDGGDYIQLDSTVFRESLRIKLPDQFNDIYGGAYVLTSDSNEYYCEQNNLYLEISDNFNSELMKDFSGSFGINLLGEGSLEVLNYQNNSGVSNLILGIVPQNVITNLTSGATGFYEDCVVFWNNSLRLELTAFNEFQNLNFTLNSVVYSFDAVSSPSLGNYKSSGYIPYIGNVVLNPFIVS